MIAKGRPQIGQVRDYTRQYLNSCNLLKYNLRKAEAAFQQRVATMTVIVDQAATATGAPSHLHPHPAGQGPVRA